jgi:hypothetical protein
VRQAALDAGFDLHLVKPLTPGVLAGALAAPGEGRQAGRRESDR